MRIAVLFVGLLASAAFDPTAMAKDTAPAEISATGVQELDDVFMKAKDIQTNLTTSKGTPPQASRSSKKRRRTRRSKRSRGTER